MKAKRNTTFGIAICLAALGIPFVASSRAADAPISLGNRLELFADDYLIAEKKGSVDFHLHRPEPKEVVFTADAPWEGNTSAYFGLFQDGDRYRMIYRGWQVNRGAPRTKARSAVTCLALSRDGIDWNRPNLGIKPFEGSKENNIIRTGGGSQNFTTFLDTNPDCPPDAKYKALAGGKTGLYYYKSQDCRNWQVAVRGPVITEGFFDSQNLAFWDLDRKEYRAYWRFYSDKVRSIRTATSKDFVNWGPHADLTFEEGTPVQHLYTNAIQKYSRAPHLFIGFPARYFRKGHRVEPLFMISRDGVHFKRYDDAVIPETAPADRGGNRSNYMAWGILSLPGKPDELSVYATEAYYGPVPGRVRRFVYRLDGFVSLRADASGGEVLTRPFTFDGSTLILNYSANQNGSLRVGMLDQAGNEIPGFTVADCFPLTGDSVDVAVKWKGGPKIESLAGEPVRARFFLESADLYSIQFR